MIYLALRTARRIAGTFLPILSLGLIILSFGLDDWYSIYHLDGEKEEGSVWREYSVEYGLYEFHYLEVWSGILGDAYRESEPASPEGLESISDYMATSMGLVIILILISFVLGLLSMTERIGPSLHMMMTLIMTMGLIITVSFYFFSIRVIRRRKVAIVEDHDRNPVGAMLIGIVPVRRSSTRREIVGRHLRRDRDEPRIVALDLHHQIVVRTGRFLGIYRRL